MTVSIIEAQQNLVALLQQAAAGESVVITLENREFEIKPKKRGLVGSLKGWKMSDDFNAPLEDMKEYME